MKKYFVDRILWLTYEHPVKVILLSIVLCFGIGGGATLLKFNDDYRIYFSKDNEDLMGWESILNTFSRTDPLIITVEEKSHENIFNPDTLSEVALLTERLWKVKYVTRVDSITNFQHMYTKDGEIVVEDLFSDKVLVDKREIDRRAQIAQSEVSIAKRMLSDNNKVTALQLQMMIPKKENAIADAAASVREVKKEFESKYPNLNIRLGGIVMLNAAFDEYARADMANLFPLMLLVFCFLIAILFRSLYITMCVVFSLLTSVAATFGVAGLIGIQFSPHSSIAPHIVFTIAIAMAVHVVLSYTKEYEQTQDRKKAMRTCLEHNFTPIFLSAVTSIAGFLSNLTSEIPPFRDLSIMCALGLVFSFINTIVLLPSMLIVKRKIQYSPTINYLSVFCNGLGRLILKREFTFVFMIVIALGISFFGLTKLRVDDHPIKLFQKGTDFRDDADFIDSNLAGTTDVQFGLNSNTAQGILNPKYLEEVDKFKDYLLKQDRVTHVQVLTDTIKRVNKSLHDDDPAFYRLGSTPEENGQYLLFYETNLPFGQELNNEIDINKSQLRLVATIKSSSSSQIVNLVTNANHWIDNNATTYDARGVSVLVMFSYMMDRLAYSQALNIIASILMISGVMIVALRSLRLGLLSMAPNIFPTLIVFGIWSFAGRTLDFSSVLIFSMTLGIIVDDTVHICLKYLQLVRDENYSANDAVIETMTYLGPPVIVNTVVLSLGFLVFGFSVFHMNVTLGILSALTFSVGLVLELIMMPILLRRFIGLRLQKRSNLNSLHHELGNEKILPTVASSSY